MLMRLGFDLWRNVDGGAAYLPIDQLGVSALAAYSLRRLRAAYGGPAIRVRRSSDNAEQDIGFSGVGLDSAALVTFTGANSAFVKTWYDQSGNARNLTQATTAAQPRIVNAGAYLGSVSIDAGANQGLGTIDAAFGLAASSLTVSSVLQSAALGSSLYGLIWGLGGAPGARLWVATNASARDLIARPGSSSLTTSPAQVLSAGGNVMAWTKGASASTATLASYLNGVGPSTYATEAFTATDNSFAINGSSNSVVSGTHAHQELILFGSVLSAAQLSTLSRNQGACFGVTVA